MFGDEASFWLDGTLHRTWSRVGVQPRVDTYGMRKTGHVFGAISLFRLPPSSPQFNPLEGGWKTVKQPTTHNRFCHTTEERDAALVATFQRLDAQPAMIAGQVARFLGATT
jgi:hypothetical protein